MATVYRHVLKDTIDRTLSRDRGASEPVRSRPMRNAPAQTERSKAEDKAQNVYANQIEADAHAITDGETYRARIALAQRVRSAIPVLEMLDRRQKLKQAQGEIPEGLGQLERMAMRDGYDRSIEDLESKNVYNPTLLAIFEALERNGKVDPESFLGADPAKADAVTRAGVEAACAILGVGKSKPLSKDQRLTEYIARRVEAEVAKYGADIQAVRKELAEWKAEQGL